jgi:selenide,water dikinase
LKCLLLLGGGHAHVQVVHAFARRHPPATQLKLIDRRPLAPYSGMLPGLIAGHYSVRESHIDLAALCRWAGVEFVQAEAVAIDLDRHTVITAPGGTHGYDLLSIDTGSTPPLDAIAGAREHALAVKPIDSFLAAMERRLPQLARKPGASLAVIGAGAAGFEVVLALQFRCCARFGRRTSPTFKLVADGDTILPGFPERARRIAERRLREQGIELHAGSAACVVDAAGLRLASGTHVPADQIVLATGAQAPPLYRESGLQTDAKGFIAVDAALRSRSHRAVFACGDIAAVLEHPRQKSGVFAVRQGPPLTRNLLRTLQGKPPLPFVPQREALALLSTGRKHAIAVRSGYTLEGAWVWRWKDCVDRSFVRRFGAPDT